MLESNSVHHQACWKISSIKLYQNLFNSFNETHADSYDFLFTNQLHALYTNIYSGTSIYCSRNDHFPACTVRHFGSRMNFHINNVIYCRIHHSPNYRFTILIVCKSRSWRSISRMDRLNKNLKRNIYYLRYLLFGL